MTPALFRIRLWLWARCLPLVSRRLDLERLLALVTPRLAPHPVMPVEAVVAATRAAVARPWRMRGRRCLREGLLAFRFLRLAGHPAVIHFGVDRGSVKSPRLKAHCWVSVGGRIVLNAPRAGMVPILAYDGAAAPTAGPGHAGIAG